MIEDSKDVIVEVIREIEEEGETLLAVVGMSIFGGLVSWLRQKGVRKFSRLIITLCTSSFSGLLAYHFTSAAGLNVQYQCAMAGIAGYSGVTLIDEIIDKIRDIIRNKYK